MRWAIQVVAWRPCWLLILYRFHQVAASQNLGAKMASFLGEAFLGLTGGFWGSSSLLLRLPAS
jgi:cell shape-determining protein MreD